MMASTGQSEQSQPYIPAKRVPGEYPVSLEHRIQHLSANRDTDSLSTTIRELGRPYRAACNII